MLRTVAVGTGAGAGYAALSMAADIDHGDAGGESRGRRGSLLGNASLEGGGGGGLAARGLSGEWVKTSCGVAVVLSGTALGRQLAGVDVLSNDLHDEVYSKNKFDVPNRTGCLECC